MSNARVEGMIAITPVHDNCEFFYEEYVVYAERNGIKLYLQILCPIGEE